MKQIMTYNCMKNIIRHKLNFNEDNIWLYIVDRKLNLNKNLSNKSNISQHIIYQTELSLKNIIEEDDKLYITFNPTSIKYNSYKYPTLGNLIIYNETIDCIMSFYELKQDMFPENEQEDSLLKKGIDSVIDFIYDNEPKYAQTAYIGNIKYIFDNIFNEIDLDESKQ